MEIMYYRNADVSRLLVVRNPRDKALAALTGEGVGGDNSVRLPFAFCRIKRRLLQVGVEVSQRKQLWRKIFTPFKRDATLRTRAVKY